MAEPVVELREVGKQYVKYDDAPLLTSHLRFWSSTKRSRLWALRGVDLSVAPGETVGVIGRNGAGKSTMLRLLAGVTGPSEGTVRVRGQVAPLISVGVGFHPELTGRENVYVNGNILGMSRRDVDARFDGIVDFAEVHDFIDTPVKFYSSGMFVRLGFAVAVAADPDVLLVDEVLAVGDFRFQAKCFRRMDELKDRGCTVVVVSHNLNAVRKMCSRTLLLNGGRPVFLGDTDEALARFHTLLDETEEASPNNPVEEVVVQTLDIEGRPVHHVREGDEITVRITSRARADLSRVGYTLAVSRDGDIVYSDTDYGSAPVTAVQSGAALTCDVRFRASLPTGSYSVIGGVRWGDTRGDSRPSRSAEFYVSGRELVKGVADLHAQFARSSGGAGSLATGA